MKLETITRAEQLVAAFEHTLEAIRSHAQAQLDLGMTLPDVAAAMAITKAEKLAKLADKEDLPASGNLMDLASQIKAAGEATASDLFQSAHRLIGEMDLARANLAHARTRAA